MFNLRWCGIAGGGAFLLSFLVALISGAGFPALLLRPFVFGVGFFALAGGIWLLINRFIPDLLKAGEENGTAGSLVDISVGDEIASQRVSGAIPGSDSEEVGNIGELLGTEPGSGNFTGAGRSSGSGLSGPETDDAEASGLDHKRQGGYTDKREGAAGNSGNSGNSAVSDALPDLDSMAGVFLSKSENSGSGAAGVPVYGGPDEAGSAGSVPEERRPKSSGKGQSMGGDYNPKDLAAAMRTILSKD